MFAVDKGWLKRSTPIVEAKKKTLNSALMKDGRGGPRGVEGVPSRVGGRVGGTRASVGSQRSLTLGESMARATAREERTQRIICVEASENGDGAGVVANPSGVDPGAREREERSGWLGVLRRFLGWTKTKKSPPISTQRHDQRRQDRQRQGPQRREKRRLREHYLLSPRNTGTHGGTSSNGGGPDSSTFSSSNARGVSTTSPRPHALLSSPRSERLTATSTAAGSDSTSLLSFASSSRLRGGRDQTPRAPPTSPAFRSALSTHRNDLEAILHSIDKGQEHYMRHSEKEGRRREWQALF